jgi:pimeloyl-ACP methyl ester carboxylesterase
MFTALQKSYIYPGSATQGDPEARVRPGPGAELLKLHAQDGTEIAALFGKAMGAVDSAHCPTVMFFYGNGQCIAYSTEIFDRFRKLGNNVIVPDYPGYGMSGGEAKEAGCYAAADAVYDYVMGRNDLDHDRLIAAGWSLGAAVAVDLASRRKVRGLLMFSAFTRMRELAARVVPWLPTSLILTEYFDSLAKIVSVKCPILLIHGQVDDLIWPEMSERLRAAAADLARLIIISQAGHNDLFDIGGEKIWQDIDDFLKSLP